MSGLVEFHEHPELTDPVLVVALDGWIDAGASATEAMSSLLAGSDATPIATFDADRLLDHRARRPIVHLVNGLITGLDWPATEVHAGVDETGRDMLLLTGAEPDFEWAGFTRAVMELIEDNDASMLVYLGAYPAPVPHTRAVNMSITTSSSDVSDRLRGYVRGSLDVPAGIQTVLDVEATRMGIPAVGLWAQVPHYISAMTYPAASLALLEALDDVAGLKVDVTDLAAEAAEARDRLDSLLAENPEHQAMVQQLETMMDAAEPSDENVGPINIGDIPSGDELAAEFQRFLQERPEDD